MNHLDTDYQNALAEAANAFMKVMTLRGFSVRDYPQNLVAHLSRQSRLHFEIDPRGEHPLADTAISQFLQSSTAPLYASKPNPALRKPLEFSPLRHRQVA